VTGIGLNIDARSLKFNDLGDRAEGSHEIGRDIPNGVGEVRKRFPSQRQNGSGVRGGGRYHNEDLERQ
jgi:hypothetical protein